MKLQPIEYYLRLCCLVEMKKQHLKYANYLVTNILVKPPSKGSNKIVISLMYMLLFFIYHMHHNYYCAFTTLVRTSTSLPIILSHPKKV